MAFVSHFSNWRRHDFTVGFTLEKECDRSYITCSHDASFLLVFSFPISQMLVGTFFIRGNYLTLGDRIGHQMVFSARMSTRHECLVSGAMMISFPHLF